jgi:adenylyltransferase/sulfurtransferase
VEGVIGSLQATEVLKEIAQVGSSLAGRLLVFDALAGRFEEIRYEWDPNNPISGIAPTIKDLSIHAAADEAVACATA